MSCNPVPLLLFIEGGMMSCGRSVGGSAAAPIDPR